MRRYRRAPNPGMLRRTASKIRLSVGALVSGLTRLGILAFPQARVHIFGVKPNGPCRPDATLTTIGNLFSGRMPVSPGIICKLHNLLSASNHPILRDSHANPDC